MNMPIMCLVAFAALRQYSPPPDSAIRIAFLRDSCVWVANVDGSEELKLTEDSLKINDFLFSPTGRFLAFSAVVGSAEEPGEWDSSETPPQREICSIIVRDLTTKRTLTQTDSEWIYIARWLPAEKLAYYSTDGFAVGSYFVYDPQSDSTLEIPDPDERMISSDFTSDESLESHTHGQDLYLFDRATNSDSLIASERNPVYDSRISNSRRLIAYVEVEDSQRTYFDILRIFDRDKSSVTALYRCPAHAKFGGIQYLGWSFDDRYLGMFYPPDALIFDIEHPPQPIRISGANFSWIGTDRFVFNRGGDIYLYDMPTRLEKTLVKHADKVMVLQANLKPRRADK